MHANDVYCEKLVIDKVLSPIFEKMDDSEVIADNLNHISACNVRGAESNDKWEDIITEFFCKLVDTDDKDEDGEDDEDETTTVNRIRCW